ncbi:LIC_11321 family protein [Leptospira inadai]|uniref:LIC_11321 family protein n=1 Tax=Leptospira inadai TaxID=29506 RepID=UPI00028A0E7B|nr:hypothetical protein [Leptospira inadai]
MLSIRSISIVLVLLAFLFIEHVWSASFAPGSPLSKQGFSLKKVAEEPGSQKKNESPSKDSEDKKKTIKGCCRIKYQGGGFDYFPATEEECVTKPGYHSFLKDSPLCFQSIWD